ncbi:MAG: hypothetical protein KF764_29515 [Labilithrix sp.]|nr:hypothetical protein [Labilithrix sp.]
MKLKLVALIIGVILVPILATGAMYVAALTVRLSDPSRPTTPDAWTPPHPYDNPWLM